MAPMKSYLSILASANEVSHPCGVPPFNSICVGFPKSQIWSTEGGVAEWSVGLRRQTRKKRIYGSANR